MDACNKSPPTSEITQNYFDSFLKSGYVDRTSDALKCVTEKKETFSATLAYGSSLMLKANYEEAISTFIEALQVYSNDEYPDEFGLTDIQVITIKFALCYSYLNIPNKDYLVIAEESLENLYFNDASHFPAVNYLYAQLLFINNRFEEVKAIVKEGITNLDEHSMTTECWPGTSSIIELTDSKILREKLLQLQKDIEEAESNEVSDSYPENHNKTHDEGEDPKLSSKNAILNINAQEYIPKTELSMHFPVQSVEEHKEEMLSKFKMGLIPATVVADDATILNNLSVDEICNITFFRRDQNEISTQTDKTSNIDNIQQTCSVAMGAEISTQTEKIQKKEKSVGTGPYKALKEIHSKCELNEIKTLLAKHSAQEREMFKELHCKLSRLEKENSGLTKENTDLKTKILEQERLQLDEEKLYFQKEEMYKQITAVFQDKIEKLEKRVQELEKETEEASDVSKKAYEKLHAYNIFAMQQLYKVYNCIFESMQHRAQKMIFDHKEMLPLLTVTSIPHKREAEDNLCQWQVFLNCVDALIKNLTQNQVGILLKTSTKETLLQMENFPSFPQIPQEPLDILHNNFKNAVCALLHQRQNTQGYVNAPMCNAQTGQWHGTMQPFACNPAAMPVAHPAFPQNASFYGQRYLARVPLVQQQQQTPLVQQAISKEPINAVQNASELAHHSRNRQYAKSESFCSKSNASETTSRVAKTVSHENVAAAHKDCGGNAPESRSGNRSAASDCRSGVRAVSDDADNVSSSHSQRTASRATDNCKPGQAVNDPVRDSCGDYKRDEEGVEDEEEQMFAHDGLKGDGNAHSPEANSEVSNLTQSNLKAHEDSLSRLKKTFGSLSSVATADERLVQKRSGGTDRLIKLIQSKYPEKSDQDCRHAIDKCRQKIGRLKGLSGDVLMKHLSEIFNEEEEEKEKKTRMGTKHGTSVVASAAAAWASVSTGPIKWNKDSSSCEECAICIENFHERSSVTSLTCQHTFHTKCIQEWMQTNSICPICRLYTTIEADYPPLPHSESR